ncbi:helix-turn-helix domain-containing protein, partial [Mycobacteroides abscessus subsp. abscessus]
MAEDPKKRLSRAEKRVQTRQRLLDAAAETFARKGFATASLDEIAEAAGFSIGAVYSNFASKDDLFAQLMADGSNQLID